MSDFIYPLILGVSLLFFFWFLLKPKKAKEVHYLVQKNKSQILDISKAYDLYDNPKNVVIAHFSDTHFGKKIKPRKIKPIIQSTIQQQPDIILFSGDLLEDYSKWPHRQSSDLIDKLKRLSAPMGKFAILGDRDYQANGQYFVKEILKSSQFDLLVNQDLYQTKENISLHLTGLDDTLAGQPVFNHPKKLSTWSILLMHETDYLGEIKNLTDYDLILTGHEFKKPLLKKINAVPLFTNGLYQFNQKTLLSIYPGFSKWPHFIKKPVIYYYYLAK